MNKAVGIDKIPAKFQKKAADDHVSTYLLSRIINLSVKPSVFPEECEIAR